jgi:hypothetical protein
VRTELVYVPDDLHGPFVERLLAHYLSDGGRLLVAEYYSSHENQPLTIDRRLKGLGFTVESTTHGFWDNVERTRIAVVRKVL